MTNTKWDYPTMSACATKLEELRTNANTTKLMLDRAFENAALASQSQAGKSFVAAYAEQSSSIQLFGEMLGSEAQLLRNNITAMQKADEEIAAQIRATFGM